MKFETQGSSFPALVCTLQETESLVTINGEMGWMSPNIRQETNSISSMTTNKYTAIGGFGTIGITTKIGGNIIPIELNEEQDYICQKSALLACSDNIKINSYLKKHVNNSGFKNKEISTVKVSGRGIVFLEVNGSPITFNLQEGQKIIVEPGHLVVMPSSCGFTLESINNSQSEEKYNAVITGPGRVVVQTAPINKLAQDLKSRI